MFNTVPKLVAYYIGTTDFLILKSYFRGHEYFGKHRLRGDVVPERQEGGYMLVAPN